MQRTPYRGDLETARELGQESIADEPFAKEAYLLLTYACSGLGLWVETTEYGRIAFCLGVEEKRLLALLAGLYKVVSLDKEADWFINEYEIDAFDFSQAISSVDQADILDVKSAPKTSLEKIDISTVIALVRNKIAYFRFYFSNTGSALPDWVEVA